MTCADPDLPFVILGAGLAGLSLGCALLDAGVGRSIVLVDRRREWGRDRTWCTWDVRPMRFAQLADHRWPAWRVTAPSGTSIMRAARTPYLHLRGDAVYQHALDRLAEGPIELLSGERVRAVRDDPGAPVEVLTDRRTLQAAEVFDARGSAVPRRPGERPGRVELAQRFLGWEVEATRPAFDPGVATLMDFRAGGPGDVRFLYVLPFTDRRALVEDTSFGRLVISPEDRREQLRRDLHERLGIDSWEVRHEEQGKVPMTDRRFALHPSPRVHAVGTAGGAVRPSSGYAFSRIQLQCDAIASAIAQGRPLPRRLDPRRRAAMDIIFLHALAQRAEAFPELFARIGRLVPGESFARFMADAGSPSDEARIIAALATPAFLGAAATSLARSTRAPAAKPWTDS